MIQKIQTRRPRILLMAFMCSPDHGSEWSVGWNRVLECVKHFDTWVICRGDKQAEEIKRYLDIHGAIPGLHFEFIDYKPDQHPVHPQGASWLTYNLWQRKALRVAKQLHEQHHFDLVHQVTNTGYREPGYAWKLDVPFVWGPVGGTHNYPWRFLLDAGFSDGAREVVRSFVNRFQLRWSLRGRIAARRASAMLVANTTGQEEFGRARGVQPSIMLETGVVKVSGKPREVRTDGGPLRILWSGQLVPRKGLQLLLKALAKLPSHLEWELQVLGNGVREQRWKNMCAEMGLNDRVKWLGWVPHSQALKSYAWADVFAFTSLRDTSGNVVLEALASGLPVICLSHQGVRDIVTDDCGIKVPVVSPRQSVDGLCAALIKFAGDSEMRARMSEAALERARDYLWARQGARMTDIYRRVLGINDTEEDLEEQLIEETTLEEGVLEAVGVGAEAGEHESNGNRAMSTSFGVQGARSFAAGELVNSTGERRAVPAQLPIRKIAVQPPKKRFRGLIGWVAGKASIALNAILGPRREPAFSILMYHRVAEKVNGVEEPTWNVTPAQFRNQLAGLLSRGYVAWPLQKLIEARRASRPIPSNVFAVTFDDGYANTFTHAWPILRELNIPATVFLATKYMDDTEPFPFDDWSAAGSAQVPEISWLPITTEQCREMSNDGLIELGAHTHSHQRFGANIKEFERDMQQCLEVLQDRFDISHPTFAVPFGAATPELIESARRAGVSCCLTVHAERVLPREDIFHWGRFNVESSDSPAVLAAKLSGWYSVAVGACRRLFRQVASTEQLPKGRDSAVLTYRELSC